MKRLDGEEILKRVREVHGDAATIGWLVVRGQQIC
jgi:hypothetical protein